jgi:glycosyltransferase involved in cell wall biosynthesis
MSSNPFHSSRIIIDATNKAARELDLYDENSATVVYDCLCNNHGFDAHAYWCAYELPFPVPIMKNAGGKPIIGLSKDNAWFAIEGGYPRNLVNWVSLGVDTKIWTPQPKRLMKDKFVVLSMIESTVRCGLGQLIDGFGEAFRGRTDCVLYIKDRNPTDVFQNFVKAKASEYNIEIVHDTRHTENHEIEKEIFSMADCHIYLNHSGTWCMTVTQGMACGVPTVSLRHSGPTDYLSHELTGMAVDYDLQEVTDESLEKLKAIGMRNFLFPRAAYYREPFWAVPRVPSIRDTLLLLRENRQLLEKLSYNAIACAKTLTWERTATNMSHVLSQFSKQISDPDLINFKSRYE